MSDNWNASAEGSSSVSKPAPQPLPPDTNAAVVSEREGLPPTYRMRADRHYVDQLAGSSSGQPVRLVPLAQLDSVGPTPAGDLRPLIDSIREVGVVHPLLIRREHSRYAVIAGRKRLAAAHALRLPTVPCIIHERSDSDADALQAADNLTVAPSVPESLSQPEPAGLHALIEAHLAAIRRSTTVPAASSLERPSHRLVQAHAWRLDWLLRATDLMANRPRPSRPRWLGAIVDDLITQFEPEAFVSGATIQADLGVSAAVTFDNFTLSTGLAGALVAVLPLVEDAERPTLVLKATETGAFVALHVVQTDASVSSTVAAHFFDDDPAAPRLGGCAARLGALAAKAVTTRHGGKATFELLERGSHLTMVFARRV